MCVCDQFDNLEVQLFPWEIWETAKIVLHKQKIAWWPMHIRNTEAQT